MIDSRSDEVAPQKRGATSSENVERLPAKETRVSFAGESVPQLAGGLCLPLRHWFRDRISVIDLRRFIT